MDYFTGGEIDDYHYDRKFNQPKQWAEMINEIGSQRVPESKDNMAANHLGPSVYVHGVHDAQSTNANVTRNASTNPFDYLGDRAPQLLNAEHDSPAPPTSTAWKSPFQHAIHDFCAVKNGPKEDNLIFYQSRAQRCVAWWNQLKPMNEYSWVRLCAALASRPIPVEACIVCQLLPDDNFISPYNIGPKEKMEERHMNVSLSNVSWQTIGEHQIPFICMFTEKIPLGDDDYELLVLQMAVGLVSCAARAENQKLRRVHTEHRAMIREQCHATRKSMFDVLKVSNDLLRSIDVDDSVIEAKIANKTAKPAAPSAVANIAARPDNLTDHPCYVNDREFPMPTYTPTYPTHASSYATQINSYPSWPDVRRPSSWRRESKGERDYKAAVSSSAASSTIGSEVQLSPELVAAYNAKDYTRVWELRYKRRSATSETEEKNATIDQIPKISMSIIHSLLSKRLVGAEFQRTISLIREFTLLPWTTCVMCNAGFERNASDNVDHQAILISQDIRATRAGITCTLELEDFIKDKQKSAVMCRVEFDGETNVVALDQKLVDDMIFHMHSASSDMTLSHSAIDPQQPHSASSDMTLSHSAIDPQQPHSASSDMTLSHSAIDTQQPHSASDPPPQYTPLRAPQPLTAMDTFTALNAEKIFEQFCNSLKLSNDPLGDINKFVSTRIPSMGSTLHDILNLGWELKYLDDNMNIILTYGPLDITINTGVYLKGKSNANISAQIVKNKTNTSFTLLSRDAGKHIIEEFAMCSSAVSSSTSSSAAVSSAVADTKLIAYDKKLTDSSGARHPTIEIDGSPMSPAAMQLFNTSMFSGPQRALLEYLFGLDWSMIDIDKECITSFTLFAWEDLNNPYVVIATDALNTHFVEGEPIMINVKKSTAYLVRGSCRLSYLVIKQIRLSLEHGGIQRTNVNEYPLLQHMHNNVIDNSPPIDTIMTLEEIQKYLDRAFYPGSGATTQVMNRIDKLLNNYLWQSWRIQPNGTITLRNKHGMFNLLIHELKPTGSNGISSLELQFVMGSGQIKKLSFYENVFDLLRDSLISKESQSRTSHALTLEVFDDLPQ